MTETRQDTPETTTQPLPEHMQPSSFDRTLPGYLELLSNLQTTQRAINLDFRSEMLGNREALHAIVSDHIDHINEERVERGQEPIVPESTDERFLVGLVQPNWSEHLPRGGGTDEQNQQWEQFKSSFSENIQLNLEEVRAFHAKIEQLHTDDSLQAEFANYSSERIAILRATATWRIAERKKSTLGKEIADLRIKASTSRRPLTSAEKRLIDSKGAHIVELDEERSSLIDSREKVIAVTKELYKAEARDHKRQLDSGLLVTDQMRTIIAEALPSLSRGEPTLFVGETGGAKTALAEYLSTEYFGVEPELVSGYGDVNTYQLMGKQELREQDGATVSEFVSGPIIRAMEQGRPLILDEINAMSPELLKRLNKIMQLRPGDTFTIQEDSGKEVIIRPGFCIIATANEKSKRYKGVDDLSVEFQNRFGANIYRIRYPDSSAGYSDEPLENIILARAAIVDNDGELPPEIDANEVYNFVKAARISQQIFSGEHGEGYRDHINTDRLTDGKPGLEETVIAPRTMVDILHKVAGSYGELSINAALTRFADGIKNAEDRKVLTSILRAHGFLKPEQEK